MATTNQTTRVLELLKRFNDGQKVCIEQLQSDPMWEGKSEKTIRRDLDVIKAYFPDSFDLIRGENGCYKAVTKSAFENFINPEILSLMVQTFNIANKSDLFENFDLDQSDRRILESKIKETDNLYTFKSKPLETNKQDSVILKKIESSIRHQKTIIIDYNGDSYEVKPYKIIFMHENFYLGCEIDHELQFSVYRISKIKSIKDTSKTFQKNPEISQFIKDMQTPFATYRQNYRNYLIEVKLVVAKEKAYFFKAKKHLKSQQEKTLDDGNLLLTYRVTQGLEVEELIKRWLPHIKVLEPLTLKEKIEGELREYLTLCDSDNHKKGE